MKSVLSVLFIAIGFVATSQSYIIELGGDTIRCEIRSTGPSKIIAMIDNKRVRYSAKNIKGYHKGGTYASARTNIPSKYGIKGWTFLQLLQEGEMSLYVMYTTRTRTDPMTNRRETTITPTFHIKMKSDENEEFVRLSMGWRKKLGELGVQCGAFIETLEEAKSGDYNENSLRRFVTIYNNCPK